ncbi:MAG: M64 family metallo-endopeptidase [Firmicutes bacterium]|nr:M64 family metallo-endopeptidase [Bacillota bacterium]
MKKLMGLFIVLTFAITGVMFLVPTDSGDVHAGWTVDEIRYLMREHQLDGGVITTEVEIETQETSSIVPLGSRDFNIERIIYSGKSDEDSIVVVLMGDGFTAGQQGDFMNHAIGVAQFMIGFYPFNLFEDLFTVYAIQVISNESGVSRRISGFPEIIVDNYFGSYRPHSTGLNYPHGLMVNRVRQLAGQAAGGIANVNMIQIIANTTYFGGVAWTAHHMYNPVLGVSLTTVHNIGGGAWITNYFPYRWYGTFIHEFGHSFGSLADEHNQANTGERPNMTHGSNAGPNMRWNHWLGHGHMRFNNIDRGPIRFNVFDSGNATGWAVPHTNCIMSTSGNVMFNAVNSAELVRRMAQHQAGETFMPRGSTERTVAFPADATRILNYAFNGNTALETVMIHAFIETIGRYAFLGTTGLRTIENRRSIPQQIDATVFAGIDKSQVVLYVPIGTAKAYIDAGWNFPNIFEREDFLTPLGITGTITAIDRAYDGTTRVELAGGEISGVHYGHNVTISHGMMMNSHVGEGKTVTIVFGGTHGHLYFTTLTLTVDITRAYRTIYTLPQNISTRAQDLSDITLPTGWRWVNPNLELQIGTHEVDIYMPGGTNHYNLYATVTVTIRQASDPTIAFIVLGVFAVAAVAAAIVAATTAKKKV